MVVPGVDDLLLRHDRMLHRIHQRPADAAAVTGVGVDETVLRTRIKGIFAIHKLRMKHHVPLLALGLQVREALPVHQVLRPGDAGGRDGRRQVAGRRRRILPLHAEDAVDPAVLVRGQAHVIHVGRGLPPLRHRDGTVPEAEVVHPVRALRHGEVALPVGAFHAAHQDILPVPLDGAAVEHRMDAEAFHQVRICLLIQVIPPEQRGVLRRQNGILISFVNPVSEDGLILPGKKGGVAFLEPRQPLLEICHRITVSRT